MPSIDRSREREREKNAFMKIILTTTETPTVQHKNDNTMNLNKKKKYISQKKSTIVSFVIIFPNRRSTIVYFKLINMSE